ncbi:unnamed protein product [Arctogadus glacialis]
MHSDQSGGINTHIFNTTQSQVPREGLGEDHVSRQGAGRAPTARMQAGRPKRNLPRPPRLPTTRPPAHLHLEAPSFWHPPDTKLPTPPHQPLARPFETAK